MLSVLLVDDEMMLLDATRLFLQRYGEMDVTTAASTTEALGQLAGHSFDAMVVDYDMPDINGIEFLKIIRAKGDTTPVIIFTGVGREHAAIEALNNGADYFIQKGENPNAQLRNMVHMIRQVVDRKFIGAGLGTSQKVLADAVRFFPSAAFAIDHDGKVITWNEAMESFTGIPAADIVGKGDGAYSIPFFGHRTPMLVDLIFKDDEEIRKHNYTLTFRDRSAVIGWTRLAPRKGMPEILWMKAAPLFDSKGVFVGALAGVMDISSETVGEQAPETGPVPASPEPGSAPQAGWVFHKILGRAKSLHREGLRLYYREGKFQDAIASFDRAIEIDPTLPFIWHDRGVCLREIGRDEEALRSFDKAADLAPEVEEILYSRAAMLRKIGLLRQQPAVIDGAIRAYQRLLELNPNHADAWNDLGVCVRESGKPEQSRQYFDRAREIVINGKDKKNIRNLDRLV